jgi:hypothetical protein
MLLSIRRIIPFRQLFAILKSLAAILVLLSLIALMFAILIFGGRLIGAHLSISHHYANAIGYFVMFVLMSYVDSRVMKWLRGK